MSLFTSMVGALLRGILAWPGDASRGQARGDAGRLGYAIVCQFCGRRLGANTHRPKSIHRNCPCGRTTRANWRRTTDVLKGRPCSRCGLHLFYKDGSQPRRVHCNGEGGHDPRPLHTVDLRGR